MSTNTRQAASEPVQDGVVDVSGVSATRVQRYVREASDDAYIERKGGRTFLVVG
jgi:hypothetical protein